METKQEQEPMVSGVPHRLLDGYDGGKLLPEGAIDDLMASAPDYIKKRAAEWAAQQQAPARGAEEASE